MIFEIDGKTFFRQALYEINNKSDCSSALGHLYQIYRDAPPDFSKKTDSNGNNWTLLNLLDYLLFAAILVSSLDDLDDVYHYRNIAYRMLSRIGAQFIIGNEKLNQHDEALACRKLKQAFDLLHSNSAKRIVGYNDESDDYFLNEISKNLNVLKPDGISQAARDYLKYFEKLLTVRRNLEASFDDNKNYIVKLTEVFEDDLKLIEQEPEVKGFTTLNIVAQDKSNRVALVEAVLTEIKQIFQGGFFADAVFSELMQRVQLYFRMITELHDEARGDLQNLAIQVYYQCLKRALRIQDNNIDLGAWAKLNEFAG